MSVEIRDVLVDLLQWLDSLDGLAEDVVMDERKKIRRHVVELFEASRAAERSTEVAADAEFPFEVGDKIRRGDFGIAAYVAVRCIGDEDFCGQWNDTGSLGVFRQDHEAGWERYIEPAVYPEMWINVYADQIGETAWSRDDADRRFKRLSELPRLGILHLRADGTTEMLAP